jgi:hypothetical protein
MIYLAEVFSIADRGARDGSGTDEIIGASLALRGVLRDVDFYSPRPIRRSSSRVRRGTGKKLVARAIHDRSAVRGQSFVKHQRPRQRRGEAPRASRGSDRVAAETDCHGDVTAGSSEGLRRRRR